MKALAISSVWISFVSMILGVALSEAALEEGVYSGNAAEVQNWAILIERYGLMMVMVIVLGILFLTATWLLFNFLLTRTKAMDDNRAANELSNNLERKQLQQEVISMSGAYAATARATVDAIKSQVEKLSEFRGDVHKTFERVERAFDKHLTLLDTHSNKCDELQSRVEKLQLSLDSLHARIDRHDPHAVFKVVSND